MATLAARKMSASEMVPVLVIAGVSSGVGKTTVTLGLLEALRRRGLAVQAFKVGPDFIDPAYHALATGRPSYNLDGWMCGREQVVATVGARAPQADSDLVEGGMCCFDGTEGLSEEGSTAQIAKGLGAPVILVLDAGALVRTAAAVVLGFEHFDPELALAGVVFNRTWGPGPPPVAQPGGGEGLQGSAAGLTAPGSAPSRRPSRVCTRSATVRGGPRGPRDSRSARR